MHIATYTSCKVLSSIALIVILGLTKKEVWSEESFSPESNKTGSEEY